MSQPSLSPTNEVPTLKPLQGPLHLYAQRTSGPISPTTNPSTSTLPGILRPTTLPPLQNQPIMTRRISGMQAPPLPVITRPFLNKVTPITSSDENITSTSDGDTEGPTTSDGGKKPLIGPLSRNLSIGTMPLSPIGLGQPLAPLTRQGSVPSMPLRRPSVDPFAQPPPALISPTTSRLPIARQPLSPTRQSVGTLPPLRAPMLPPITRTTDKSEES